MNPMIRKFSQNLIEDNKKTRNFTFKMNTLLGCLFLDDPELTFKSFDNQSQTKRTRLVMAK